MNMDNYYINQQWFRIMKHRNGLDIYKRVRYAVRCSGCDTRTEWNEMRDMKWDLIERFGA